MTDAVSAQLYSLVTVSVYVPAVVTSIVCVSAPLLHEYVDHAAIAPPSRVILDSLQLNVHKLGDIDTIGNALLSSTSTVSLSIQLFGHVTVNVYVPASVAVG